MTATSVVFLAVATVAVVALLWVVWAWLRLREQRAGSPESAYTRGLTALIAGERREALRALKEAVQHDSENIDAYIRLGDLLRESGETSKALAVHRDLTVRPRLSGPDRLRILESLTRDYLAAGRFEEAGQSADRLRQLERNHAFAHRALQKVAEALEDWPRAIQAVAEQERIRGTGDKRPRAEYLCRVGLRDLERDRIDDARKRFQEALKLDPGCVDARLHLGDLANARGEGERAVEHWREFAFSDPARAGTVFERLERAHFELGQFADVVAFYRELLHRTPREGAIPALLALAEIHRRKGDLEEAETFVDEALEIDPEHPRAHRHKVKIALDRGDAAEALRRVDRLLESTASPGPRSARPATGDRPPAGEAPA